MPKMNGRLAGDTLSVALARSRELAPYHPGKRPGIAVKPPDEHRRKNPRGMQPRPAVPRRGRPLVSCALMRISSREKGQRDAIYGCSAKPATQADRPAPRLRDHVEWPGANREPVERPMPPSVVLRNDRQHIITERPELAQGQQHNAPATPRDANPVRSRDTPPRNTAVKMRRSP